VIVLFLGLIQVNVVKNEISVLAEVNNWVVDWMSLWLVERSGELRLQLDLRIFDVLLSCFDFAINAKVWNLVVNGPVWGVPGGLAGSLVPRSLFNLRSILSFRGHNLLRKESKGN
jgi:hypothetical protein